MRASKRWNVRTPPTLSRATEPGLATWRRPRLGSTSTFALAADLLGFFLLAFYARLPKAMSAMAEAKQVFRGGPD